jgi:hypothetical protein
LDLPDPFGPTTHVMPGSKFKVVAEANDLKPRSVKLLRYNTRLSSGLPAGRPTHCNRPLRRSSDPQTVPAGVSRVVSGSVDPTAATCGRPRTEEKVQSLFKTKEIGVTKVTVISWAQ